MQSGKSTIAGRLVTEHGYTLVKFADPVKYMVACLLREAGVGETDIDRMLEGGLKEVDLSYRLGCDYGVTPRFLLQTLGTDWGRKMLGKQVWTKLASRRIDALLAQDKPVVVDDVRFPEELSAILQRRGLTFKVTRTLDPRFESARYRGHPSEGLLDTAPLTELNNEGSIEELHALTDSLVTGDIFK
jgi:hypothetical protein